MSKLNKGNTQQIVIRSFDLKGNAMTRQILQFDHLQATFFIEAKNVWLHLKVGL